MKKTEPLQYYLAGAVAFLTFLVYLPSLQNEFVDWDDNMYVYENSHIRSINASFLRWAFTNFDASNWHPLAWLSHAVDYALWGLNPAGHHLTSIVLHGVNSFVIVLLIIRLLEAVNLPSRADRKTLIAAATTGLLFGLHPLHVESVAWISERKDLLCALFFMLGIMSYARYAQAANREPLQGAFVRLFSDRYYLLSLLYCLLAVMSKPMAVSLPVVLLILDWHPFDRVRSLKSLRFCLIEKLPFIALSLLSSILTILAQKKVVVPMQSVFLSERLLVAPKALISYLAKMIVPVDLIPFYQYPYPQDISALSLEYALPVILAIGITAAVVMAMAKGQKSWAALWGYYIVTLFPVLGIVQVGAQAMADRYTYLPSLAPFFLAGLLTARVAGKAGLSTQGRRAAKLVFFAALIAAIVSLSSLTVRQIHIWKSGVGLWSYVKDKNPNVHIAHVNLGLAYMRQGRMDDAVSEFKTGISLNTVSADAHNYLGVAYYKQGRLDEAVSEYKTASSLDPGYARARFNLGLAYFQKDLVDEAVGEYRAALSLDPDDVKARRNLGSAYARQGRIDDAVREYETALRLDPYFADAHYNLGTLYSSQGRLDEAAAEFLAALRISPDYADVHNNLGVVYADQGRLEEAVREYKAALQIKPDYAKARNNLGNAYAELGRIDEAVGEYKKAVRLDPGYADAHYNLGAAYGIQGRNHEAVLEYKAALTLKPGFAEARERLKQLSEKQ